MVQDLSPFPCFLFLDIDGVLSTFGELLPGERYEHDKYGTLFDPQCVGNLEWLLRESGAGLVISSAWRTHDLRDTYLALDIAHHQWCDEPTRMRELFAYRGIAGTIVDSTPYLTTLFPGGGSWHLPRGVEIEAWQRRYKVDRVPYAIIDDETDVLLYQQDRFVQTQEMHGLTRERAEAALEMLKRPMRWPWEEECLARDV